MSQDRIHKILDPEVDIDQEALDSFECGADVNLNELTIGTQLYYLYNEADTNTQSWYWGCIIEIDESRKHGEIYHIYHDDEDPFIDLSKDRNDWKRIAPHSLYFDREFKRNSNSEKSQSPPSHSQPPTVAKRSNKKPSKNTKNSSTKNDIKNSNSKSVKIGEHGIVCIVPNQPMACTVIGGPLACEAVKLECDWLPLTLKYAFWARKSDLGETEKLHAQEPQVSFVLNGETGRYRVIECASPSQTTRTFVQCRWADIHAPTWIAVSDFYSISDTTATTTATIAANNQKRKRGRPKGSKNKKRKTDSDIAGNQNSTPQSWAPALQHAPPPPPQSIISTSPSTSSKNSNSNSETRAQSAVLKLKSDSESKKRYQMLANQRHSFFASNHVVNSAMQPPQAPQPHAPQPQPRQSAQFGICENHVNQFTHAQGNVYAIYYPSSHYMQAAPPPPPQPQQQQAQSSLRVVTLQQLQTLQRIQQQQQQQQQQNRVAMPTQPTGRTRGVKRSASHMLNDAHVQADQSARKRQRMSTSSTQQQSAQQQQLYLFAPQIRQFEQRVCAQMPPLQKETETDASSMDTGDSVAAAAYACIGKQANVGCDAHSVLSSSSSSPQQQQACHRKYCSSSAPPPPVSASSSSSALSTHEDAEADESNAFASFRDLAVLPLQHITRQLSDGNMSTEDRLCALQGILKYVTNCQKYLCQFSHQYANVVQCVQAIITDLQRQDS